MATVTDRRRLVLAVCGLLAGCGLTQTVKDGSVRLTKSLFYQQITTLHLDFSPRAASNAAGDQTPLATMVRVYQLKARNNVDSADYPTLLRNAQMLLKDDILAAKSLLIMPAGSVTLDMPLDENARFVAVVGWFNRPDQQNNTWRLVLSREQLDPNKPRTIELGASGFMLRPLKG